MTPEPRIDWRTVRVLLRCFVLMDLRGQHFASATGTKPHHLLSPLFWVVGQCVTLSAIATLTLFARVDVWFFALVNLSLGIAVLATTILVEFHEAVLDPRDADILGHRPIPPTTYAAARFGNLLFYVVLMGGALNVIPMIVGAGLRDAGPWFIPAYAVAAWAGNLVAVAVVVITLATLRGSRGLEFLKQILAWTQIILILIFGYGAQLMLRDGTYRVQMFAAYPPDWLHFAPTAPLARFVEEACQSPTMQTLGLGILLLAIGALAAVLTVWRVSALVRRSGAMAERIRLRRMKPTQVGRVPGLLPTGLRVGYWFTLTHLRRDGDLLMRCILPLATPIAAVIVGVASGQFANPRFESSPALITLPVLAMYLIPLAVVPIMYNLCFTRDYEASWILRLTLPRSGDSMVVGAGFAVLAHLITPLCLVMGLVCWWMWQDVLMMLVFMTVPLGLSMQMMFISFWVIPGLPFSLPLARGGSLGPIALPLAAISAVLFTLAAIEIAMHPPGVGILPTIVAAVVVPLLAWRGGKRLERLNRSAS